MVRCFSRKRWAEWNSICHQDTPHLNIYIPRHCASTKRIGSALRFICKGIHIFIIMESVYYNYMDNSFEKLFSKNNGYSIAIHLAIIRAISIIRVAMITRWIIRTKMKLIFKLQIETKPYININPFLIPPIQSLRRHIYHPLFTSSCDAMRTTISYTSRPTSACPTTTWVTA